MKSRLKRMTSFLEGVVFSSILLVEKAKRGVLVRVYPSPYLMDADASSALWFYGMV
jgi:hypothetical protein